jgi:hypothetical protein
MRTREIKMYFDGVEVPVTDVSMSFKGGERHGERAWIGSGSRGTTRITMSQVVPATTLDLERPFGPTHSSNASESTLARRILYGGRKGRSAWRRLRAKGYLGVMRFEGDARPMLPMDLRTKVGRFSLAKRATQPVLMDLWIDDADGVD